MSKTGQKGWLTGTFESIRDDWKENGLLMGNPFLHLLRNLQKTDTGQRITEEFKSAASRVFDTALEKMNLKKPLDTMASLFNLMSKAAGWLQDNEKAAIGIGCGLGALWFMNKKVFSMVVGIPLLGLAATALASSVFGEGKSPSRPLPESRREPAPELPAPAG